MANLWSSSKFLEHVLLWTFVRPQHSNRQHSMKHILALFLGMSLVWSTNAQSLESSFKKVAIISLIGDVMTIDTYRRRVGTLVDSNYQEIVPLPKPVFDHAALGASEAALAKLIPATSIASLMVPTPGS